MNNLQKNKWLVIVYGVLLIAIGTLTLIFAITNTSVVDKVISIALAVALFIVGLLNICSSLIAHTQEFYTATILLGSLAIAIGVVLLIDTYLIGSIIVYLLGVFLLAMGTVSLFKAVIFVITKQKVMWIVAQLIIAALAITLGVIVLCFKDESKMFLYAFIGAVIILSGITEIVFVLRNFISNKEDNKEEKVEENPESKEETEEAEEEPKEQA